MTTIAHKFVDLVPNCLESGVLYVSIAHGTAVHRCCCGCGLEVVTPLRPTDWRITFDGETVTLHPSIGNWQFPCKSHYWIRNGKVEWSHFASETVKDWSDLGKEPVRSARGAKEVRKSEAYSNRPLRGLWSLLWRGR